MALVDSSCILLAKTMRRFIHCRRDCAVSPENLRGSSGFPVPSFPPSFRVFFVGSYKGRPTALSLMPTPSPLRDTARAMSQENVELAGRVLDALARRDVSRLVDLSDPEVRWHSFFAEVTFGAGRRVSRP